VYDVQMAADLWIFACELIKFLLGQGPELRVESTRELVIELAEQFGINEEISRSGELICHCVQEDLRTDVFAVLVGASLTLDCEQTHAQDVSAIAKEHGLSALRKKSSGESTSTSTAVAFEVDIPLSDLVDEGDNILEALLASHLCLNDLDCVFTIAKFVLENSLNILTAARPFRILEINAMFVGLDTDL